MEMRVPVGIRQHDIGSAVGAAFIGGVEEASEEGLNANHVEIVSTHFDEPGAGWFTAGVECRGADVLDRQSGQTVVPVAQIEIRRIGLIFQRTNVIQREEGIRLWHVHRAQDERVEQGKHQRVRADGKRQRENRNAGEAGRPTQHSQAVTNIPQQHVERGSAHRGKALFPVAFPRAIFDAGTAFGLLAGQTPALQVVGTQRNMRLQLLFHIGGNSRAMEKSGYE